MKKFFVKVFAPNGDYITTFSDVKLNGFNKQINGGLGQLTFELARKFDDFNEGIEIKHNNKIEVWISDKDTTSIGKRIYSGFISGYSPVVDEGEEKVKVYCLGYISKLDTSLLRNGSTIAIKYNSYEIANIVKNIIDRYQAEATNPVVNYTSTSIENTGTTTTYLFEAKTFKEALDKCVEMSPADFYYYIDADNILHFKQKPSTPTHRFIFGKHFKKVSVFKNMEKVWNNILFFNSSTNSTKILKRYRDINSENNFDDRWYIITDGRVKDMATANSMANSFLNERKDAEIDVEVEIIDNNESDFGYDIELIEPGDTCQFLGFNTTTSQTFSDNMLIKEVDYKIDKVVIRLESLQESLARQQNKTRAKIKEESLSDIPSTFSDAEHTWTPTFSCSGSMTFTNTTIHFAKYFIIGDLVFFQLKAEGTTGGTASTAIYFTFPTTAESSSGTPFSANYIDGGGARVGTSYQVDSTKGAVLHYDLSNWGLGSGRTIYVSGVYRSG